MLGENESYAGGDGNYNCQLLMGDHCGTHVDSPSHFIPQGKTIEQVDVLAGALCRRCGDVARQRRQRVWYGCAVDRCFRQRRESGSSAGVRQR
ncbi:MAG: cyclase family protein [Pantoea sp.]|nr:cyclase family protein [Pantoea sp.]